MSALGRALTYARAEFASARLRLGVWLALGIVLLYLAFVQADRVDAVFGDYLLSATEVARAETLRGDRDWPQLLEAERQANAALKERLWTAATPGLAQAALQETMRAIIGRWRFRNPRITPGVSQRVPQAAGLWRVQVRVDGGYPRGAELEVLDAIATHPKRIVIDRLALSNSRLSLVVSAYFVGVEADDG